MPASGDSHEALLGALLDEEVEFVLVGGLAAVVHGVPVVTFDVDIVHRRTPDNAARLHRLLQRLGAFVRGRGEQRLLPGEQALLGPGHSLLRTDLGDLDVLGAIEGGATYDDLLADAVEVELGNRVLPVVRLERLAALKAGSSRHKDRLVLLQIEETLRLRDG